jgi:hypothetical protein
MCSASVTRIASQNELIVEFIEFLAGREIVTVRRHEALPDSV